jgi:hypothetical protein
MVKPLEETFPGLAQSGYAITSPRTKNWTSKLGELEDIEHALGDLTGMVYGSIVLVMKRPVSAAEEEKAGGKKSGNSLS